MRPSSILLLVSAVFLSSCHLRGEASRTRRRELRQSVNDCSGSLINSAIGQYAASANAEITSSISGIWPTLEGDVSSNIVNLNKTENLPPQNIDVKQCSVKFLPCLNLSATISGQLTVHHVYITNVTTPSAQISSITCQPGSTLSGSALIVIPVNISAQSVAVNITALLQVSIARVLSVPLKYQGVVTINHPVISTVGDAQIAVAASLSDIISQEIPYTASLNQIQNTTVTIGDVVFAPSILPAGLLSTLPASLLTQARARIQSLITSQLHGKVTNALQSAINKELPLTYSGKVSI
ncbi:hypothetical protein CEUSTIGMA_g12842.t1 [Chlamydomonas eustigma]|uniref:Lipid-binding serum glycoprotein N-terminal domain-containing protein n=1 Tax=Chlamydomonas eustigma TaxID=1157962 RepID=A0A250XQU9_9CHLO|nr:hypothetical protein CEUSTIGMA_g12842.t1 [Chlamydomonas eustigma]|eukprot:GAX85426.1 hypothetical protein CEUSTIGMA_g12842.t1 [Chlamydomonas eustigma]